MKRLLAVLVTLVAAWLGALPAATVAPATPVLSYTYDGHHYAEVATRTTTERGPPVAHAQGATYDTVGRWPNGASVRSEEPTPPGATPYDDPIALVQVAQATSPTGEQAQRTSGELSSFQGWQVAANAGSGRLGAVLKSGERGAIGRGLSPNQMNRAIKRGQGPSGITRIDTPKIPHEKLHATFEDGSALNVDGTWKHGGLDLTRDQSSWLVENGWTLP